MFGKTWKTSERKYRVLVERDVRIPMRDGIEISADVFRPDSPERFPAIFGFHPYRQESQTTAPIKPDAMATVTSTKPGVERSTGYIESGDPNFYVRRGYSQIVASERSGESEIRRVGEVVFLSGSPFRPVSGSGTYSPLHPGRLIYALMKSSGLPTSNG